MLQPFHYKLVLCIGAASTLSIAWWAIASNQNSNNHITTYVEVGDVTSTVNVSGFATVEETIPLSFPQGGTVSNVLVQKGDTVDIGSILAIVGSSNAEAEYTAAAAEVQRAQARRDELRNGQTTEERAVTDATISSAEAALTATIRSEAARVEAARVTLFSTDLSVIPQDSNTEAPAPVVSGSYLCSSEGTYTIEPYRSGALSGYSFRFSGIETGTNNLFTNQAGPLGTCGLRLQFTEGANYSNTVWTLTIPNTTSSTYPGNQAAYELARTNETQNIANAQEALNLALNRANAETAGARVESLIAANAAISVAEARLAQVANTLRDTAIRAPRPGVITTVDVVAGQTVGTAPVITLFSPTRTTFTARVPEIDVRKIAVNQSSTLSFDANHDEVVTGLVSFISPLPTTIDGVAYFDATITLDTTPDWLRSSMQADVQIITEDLTNVLRIPRRFLSDNTVLVWQEGRRNSAVPTPVTVEAYGTDGYVAISGVPAHTVIIAP